MKIEFVESNYDIGERLKEIIKTKIDKLDKYFGDDANARVVCKLENKTYKLEVTIKNKGCIYRSEVIGENMYENIDLALPKIERQVVRHATKKRDQFRKQAFETPFLFIEEEPKVELPEIYKKKTFDLDPISVDDAREFLEMLGHNFYIFLNNESGKINVLYKRADGKYGLIEVNY